MSALKRVRYLVLAGCAGLLVGVVVALAVWQPWTGSDDEERLRARDKGTGGLSLEDMKTIGSVGILATTDLGLGRNRISFLLEGADGIVRVPQAMVTSLYFPDSSSDGVPRETATARLYEWPYGVRANYALDLAFDVPGEWALDVRIPDDQGEPIAARIPIIVKDLSFTPALGSQAPATDNKTLADVESIEQLTSWYSADPELYQLKISEAIEAGKPLVLTFSSPSICTSPTCGPQAETIKELKDKRSYDANFIHVEVYDNPADIQGDLNSARYAPVADDWGFTSIEGYLNESWVFILDSDGRVVSKYEGFASAEELELGLRAVLR